MGGWLTWALVSPDGVAPSWIVCVSASVNLPLHHKVQKFSMAQALPGGPGKRAVKWLWCGGTVSVLFYSPELKLRSRGRDLLKADISLYYA